MPESPNAGFALTHEMNKLTAWGPAIPAAFEAALTGLLHAAGAPEGIQPGDKSITVHGKGAGPAELLDDLIMALSNEHEAGQPLDGSIVMGGVVKSEVGWNGWASAGINPERETPLGPFELLKPPLVEVKPGRVTIKAQLMVWDGKMLAAMDRLRSIAPIPFHPGGVFGPEPLVADPE